MYLQLMAFMPITFHPLFRATIKTISLHKQLCQMRYILGTIAGSAFFLKTNVSTGLCSSIRALSRSSTLKTITIK